ncbi:uncharacterized protein LOC117218029 [Megalopta genalis]|uniref:uncharacterized protein LOC117218029 n=1 Tax=Megalopta genalis TaxID=115081 RepID=UPI003FD381E8
MDKNIGAKQNYEEFGNTENQGDNENDRVSIKSHPTSQQNLKRRSHSRSRSPINTKCLKRWVSSNAFVNFIQDFREKHAGVKGSKIYKLAGEKWKQMLPKEKQPYVDAAKSIKNQKQDQQKKDNINAPNPANVDSKKDEKSRQTKNTKKSKKDNKEKKQKKRKKYNTESDTDSAVSATSATTITSDDLSDMSS